MKITFDGSEATAKAICSALREHAPDQCDDQAPSYLTDDANPGTAFDLRLWMEDGDEVVNVGDVVTIAPNAVTIERSDLQTNTEGK